MIADRFFFHIETLPTVDKALIAEIAAQIRPPATITNPETIAAWEENERPAAIAKAVALTALDGGYGRIASIAWCRLVDDKIFGGHSAEEAGWTIERERFLLQRFFDSAGFLFHRFNVKPILVGHNILDFDIRWIWKRAIVLGIVVPEWWPISAKVSSDKVIDTMTLWEGKCGRISQDRLAKILDIAGKGNVDGSMIADMWAKGCYYDVLEYTVCDVWTVREIWKRITGWTPAEGSEPVTNEDSDYSDDIADLTTRTIETAPAQTVADVLPTVPMALFRCNCGQPYFAPEERDECPSCAGKAALRKRYAFGTNADGSGIELHFIGDHEDDAAAKKAALSVLEDEVYADLGLFFREIEDGPDFSFERIETGLDVLVEVGPDVSGDLKHLRPAAIVRVVAVIEEDKEANEEAA